MGLNVEKLSQSLEDYLESIYIISLEKKIARVKDLVNRLGVKSSSVIGALKKLGGKGYIEHEHYGHIELTEEGRKRAERLYDRHTTLTKFFHNILNVDEKTAEEDACRIEHDLSEESYRKIIKLLAHIISLSETDPACFKKLKKSVSD